MSLLHIFSIRWYYKHFLFVIILYILLLLSLFLILKFYTHHSESITVPDLTGLSEKEADKIIKERALRFIVIDSVYLSNKEKGSIVEQYPLPNDKVKEDRVIFLTINSVLSKKIRMPSLTGISVRQAMEDAKMAGLQVSELEYIPYEHFNLVVDQKYRGKSVPQGTFVEDGASIVLVVGQGTSDEKTQVPVLYGLYREQAVEKVKESFLNIGAVVYDLATVKNFQDTLNARIWKQDPAYRKDAEMPMGSYIDIWLTTDSLRIPVIDTSEVILNEEL